MITVDRLDSNLVTGGKVQGRSASSAVSGAGYESDSWFGIDPRPLSASFNLRRISGKWKG